MCFRPAAAACEAHVCARCGPRGAVAVRTYVVELFFFAKRRESGRDKATAAQYTTVASLGRFIGGDESEKNGRNQTGSRRTQSSQADWPAERRDCRCCFAAFAFHDLLSCLSLLLHRKRKVSTARAVGPSSSADRIPRHPVLANHPRFPVHTEWRRGEEGAVSGNSGPATIT